MRELYLLTTIIDRNQNQKFISFYREYGVSVVLNTLGQGTAISETLDSFGLEATEKAILFSVVTDTLWREIKSGLEKQLKIDIPGTGIAFVMPLSSIGGKRQLQFLTQNQRYELKEESILRATRYDLLVVIANQGYTELIMEAARSAKAAGGTVIHAKGAGMEGAEKFLGVSLAIEKEMVFIVVKSRDKNNIMQAIMQKAGMESKAKSIVFSLPVVSTAGMRLTEDTDGFKSFFDYMDEMPVRFIQFTLEKGHAWENKKIKDIILPPDTHPALLVRGDARLIPDDKTALKAGDTLILSAKAVVPTVRGNFTEMFVDGENEWVGKTLSEIAVDDNMLIAVIQRGGKLLIPDDQTVLRENDLLIINHADESGE